jgi:hypothetical protein
MRKTLLALAATAAMALATGASAATLSYNFASPTGNVGTSETYTSNGLSVTAYGFTAFNNAQSLYGKNGGAGEMGLGFLNNDDHEIGIFEGYVALDVSGLFGKVAGNTLTFTMDSTTDGEQWSVYGSNTLNSLGTFLFNGGDEAAHNLTGLGTYKYYDFKSTSFAGGGDVLLSTLSATTAAPEPATWALMLAGIGAAGAMLRRRRAIALAAA